MKKQKSSPMQKPMTVAELRVLLAQKQKQLDACVNFNDQWQIVAQNLERQKKELLAIVERQQNEILQLRALLGNRVRQ